ncbi:sulfurtransferase TusD [Arenicella chitinivorans]|uniref:Sulfurtransferase TusD n=1 Tax=Arenicella chitinivorans TaxID=1329800 RepID=A0A918RPD7_9GAMM|nr:sulfurtransferase complex subunit TusD [Arenicella chitinivorans]GHA07167.1 sulfurtransferase TusD [Arenicella chitinivorans]
MQINLLVTGDAFSSQAGQSALQFARAAIARGHQITQVFFYQDGVTQASDAQVPLADEFDAPHAWSRFARQHDVRLVVCVSAAERRGVLNQEQAIDAGKTVFNVHPDFHIEGLGVMHDASFTADRTVTFK